MIKVTSFKICPFVQRVTALLEAKKKPYEIDYIKLNNKPQWFLDISPTGQVPLLITESGIALFESDAIVEYINDTTQSLDGNLSPEQKALSRAWCYQGTKHYLAQCSAMRSADQTTFSERNKKLAKAFALAEQHIKGPFFNGNTLGNIDIAWLPLLHRAAIIKEHTSFDFLDGYPKLQQWQSAVMATGLAQQSVATDFEQHFTRFYITEHTFLGNKNDQTTFPRQGCC